MDQSEKRAFLPVVSVSICEKCKDAPGERARLIGPVTTRLCDLCHADFVEFLDDEGRFGKLSECLSKYHLYLNAGDEPTMIEFSRKARQRERLLRQAIYKWLGRE